MTGIKSGQTGRGELAQMDVTCAGAQMGIYSARRCFAKRKVIIILISIVVLLISLNIAAVKKLKSWG